MRTIKSLVKKAQKGDQHAFMQLFSQYEADIYRMAFLYLNNQEDAMDAVQETAYRSYRALPRLKKPNYFKTWLIRIAIHCSLDLLRRRQGEVPLVPDYEEWLPNKSEELDLPLSLSLQDMIKLLSNEEKSVVHLRFYHDYTIKEIATILEIPLGTIKTILYRALRKLRKQAEEGDWIE